MASREYFHTLLYGPYAESTQKEIKLEGSAAPFKQLLKYIYFDGITLSEMKLDEIVEVMGLARMYNFSDLTASIEKYIEKDIYLNRNSWFNPKDVRTIKSRFSY